MLIATPNICLDVTIRIPQLVPGTVIRSTFTATTAGGKGVNVSRAARALGAQPTLTGFLPEDDGPRFVTLIRRESVPFLPVDVPGVLRIASILLGDDGVVTVINGRGPDIDNDRWNCFADSVAEAVAAHEVLVCSGSLPPGVSTDAYAVLTSSAHAAGVPALVDAGPAVLAAALAVGPDLVSPNLSEAEGLLLGRTDEQVHEEGDDVPDRAIAAARALHHRGAVRGVVTAGAAGAALATAGGAWWLPAVAVDVVNPIGAGDCFAAGAGLALARGETDIDVVRYGMAAASASCETPLAGFLAPERAAELFDRIQAVPA